MTVLAAWQPATAYSKGSTVRPNLSQASIPVPLDNGDFEDGDTSWTKDAGWAISSGSAYEGTYKAIFTGAGSGTIKASGTYPATAGQVIRATVKAKVLDSDDGATAVLLWYNASNVLIETSTGLESSVENGVWMQLEVSGTGPNGAAYVVFAVEATRTTGASVTIDDARWDYQAPIEARRVAYRAVQDAVGVSGVVEPDWPTTLGNRITDGTIVWEAVELSWIEWTTYPILESGLTEPNWPTTVGAFVRDGTVNWECVSRRVEDENCPNTPVVCIINSKVFAVDGDIVRYCATAQPLDWTSEQDAGYLPTGLQQANANDMAVLAPYRGNLCAWNANCFQMWQSDPDPSQMALLDQMDGIGSMYPLAALAVGNDLYFLAAQGVRSIGIANAAQNMQAGDVGMPIDTLVQAEMAQAEIDGKRALSTYWPGMGQYWLTFGDDGVTAGAGGALAMACPALIEIFVGVPYSYTYVATGGTPPYTFSIASGSLPAGLTLDAETGVLSGTIETVGSYSFGVKVTDSLGVEAFCGWAAEVLEDEVEVTDPWRFLATGSTGGNLYAGVRPIKAGMTWYGASDIQTTTQINSSTFGVKRYGDKFFAIVRYGTGGSSVQCRVSDISDIETWTAGPTLASVGGTLALGHTSVFGGRLWIACLGGGVANISTVSDAAFATDTSMLSLFGTSTFQQVTGITGNGTNVLCINGFGKFVRSSNQGSSWSAGANNFGSGNRFYTDYGAIDSNGDRAVAAGGETALRAFFTDDNGGSATECTVPACAVANQVKYVGSDRWLIACRGGTTTTNCLAKSLDNGATFTAVTLPVALDFYEQSNQNIAVDGDTGRVVIAGFQVGTGTRRYYYSDDPLLVDWTEFGLTGSEMTGITDAYPLEPGE